jgi:hypothetical protein
MPEISSVLRMVSAPWLVPRDSFVVCPSRGGSETGLYGSVRVAVRGFWVMICGPQCVIYGVRKVRKTSLFRPIRICVCIDGDRITGISNRGAAD